MKVAVRQVVNQKEEDIYKMCFWWCPGCNDSHIWRAGSNIPNRDWQWNGDIEKPTVSPSILTDGSRPEKRCHVFIKDGMIQYLSDCWHELAGQTVPMVDVPEYLID